MASLRRCLPRSWVSAVLLCGFSAVCTIGVAAGEPRGTSPSEASTGSWSGGGDLGFQNPTGDGDFDAEPLVGGFIQYDLSKHLSWRGSLQVVDLDRPVPRPAPGGGDFDMLIASANALYSWPARPGNTVTPFVTGGLGIYRYDFGAGRGTGSEAGLNLGGGLDLYMSPLVDFKIESLVHVTAEDEGPDSFVAGTVGAKFHW